MPTPQSILDDDSTDIFESAVANTVTYYTEKRAKLWLKYRYVGIGSYDQTYWAQCVADREALIAEKYDMRIRAWLEFKTRTAAAASVDISDGTLESESVQSHYDPPETISNTEYLDTKDVNSFTQTTHGGYESRSVREWSDGVRDPWEDWLEEFRDLFYWGM